MIEIVSATKLSEHEFWDRSALGISLQRFAKDRRLTARIAFENSRGLPMVFNASIDAQENAEIIVFIHDDVWIDDDAFVDKVLEGLEQFDIVGVAGNRRRVRNQPAWPFVDEYLTWDSKENLRGRIAHGKFPFGDVSVYGATPAECELLDGVFIAARRHQLKAEGVRFDPCFDFHFYDLDFCRSARVKGLRLGVYPISLTHQSGGAFGSQRWRDNYRLYLDKWEAAGGFHPATRASTGKPDVTKPSIFPVHVFQQIKQAFSRSPNPLPNPTVASSQMVLRQVDLQDEYRKYNKLGNESLANGNLDRAAECYSHMVAVNPNSPAGFLNLGFILKQQNYYQDAERYFRLALRTDPSIVDAYYLLGTIAHASGRLAEAIEHYRRALELKPDFEIVYGELCLLLFQIGQDESAKKVIKQGLSLYPQSARFHCYLGNLYFYEKELEKAVACYLKALSIQSDYVEAITNLGKVFGEQGNIDEAIVCYRKALALEPGSAEANSALLFYQSFHANCSPAQYLAEATRYGSIVLSQAKPYTSWSAHPTGGDMQPLRVGLVSGDLRNHPVGFFLENILANLNPSRVELVAYPTAPLEDELTARIKPRFVAWNSIAELDDATAAARIHADGIHILMDLAGHTTHSRLPVFAWKPAPVQVSWLGYFASTGMPGMDYLLADPVSVPESHKEHFSETIWYLPDTRLCFTPPATSSRMAPAPLPAIHNGFITFGCFQSVSKINDDVLNLWGKIFHALPDARLRLQSLQMKDPAVREQLLQRLAQAGIARQRVATEEPMTREAYLAGHAHVDILLDTFPYPGGTTTCEALWMGVPTVTLAGNTMLSRQGASLLTCAGLKEWIANSEKDYVALAIAHASDIDRLAQLRSGLRQNVLASPLFDASRFALNLEDALHGMWQHALASSSPDHHV